MSDQNNENVTDVAVVEHESNALTLGVDNIVELARQAKQRVAALQEIKEAALQVTSEDWIDEQGKPYLAVSGSEKIANLFGISWRIEEMPIDTEESGHYTYNYKGTFTWRATNIEVIGSRSSKDPFFSRKTVWKDNERTSVEKPVTEIDRADVRKAAYTNCIGNGITRLLGLRGMTWEQLAKAGIQKPQKGQGRSVTFQKPQPKATPPPVVAQPPKAQEPPDDLPMDFPDREAKPEPKPEKTRTLQDAKAELAAIVESNNIAVSAVKAICEKATGYEKSAQWPDVATADKALAALEDYVFKKLGMAAPQGTGNK